MAVRISESLHEGCPKQPSVRERIEDHLGHIREAGPDEPAIDVLVRVARRNGLSYGTLTLSLAGVSIDRKASSRSCADVVAALSMMAAIALGEEADRLSTEASEGPSAALPIPPPTLPPEPRSKERSGPVVPSSRHPARVPLSASDQPASSGHADRVMASLGAGVEINGNRGVVLMPSWFAQLTLPVHLDPTLRVGLARSIRERASSSRGEVAIRWSEITWAGCADFLRTQQPRLGGCVNGELGRLEAAKVDPLPARERAFLWLSLGISGKLTWDLLPGFSVEMMVGARVPVTQRELYFNPYKEPVAYKSPLIVPFVGIGLVARVP